ncbi:MAG: carboxymuconolactone decarboxylase family protein [Burkholderiales bacterium]|nr:carboxymuconolactone decarboxylase family protein [Burkholderiales bacterium]
MEAGVAVRREVLGAEYVDRGAQNTDGFSKAFQALTSEYCWGLCWSDPTLSRRERSILNLGMIAALNRMEEFELHCRGAIRNGITEDELRAIIMQIAVYCGIPAGANCFRIGRKVFAEMAGGKAEAG